MPSHVVYMAAKTNDPAAGGGPNTALARSTPLLKRTPSYVAETRRRLRGPRRPVDVPHLKDYLEDCLRGSSPDEYLQVQHQRVRPLLLPPAAARRLATAHANRDQRMCAELRHPDTYLAFAGPEFCDLIAATDNPAAVDLSALHRVGNHTLFITYARNIETGTPDDALVALAVHCSAAFSDGLPRLLAAVAHADDSISTFLYPYTEIGPHLAEVEWGAGLQLRTTDLTTEQRLISNTLGLIGRPQVHTETPWRHYTKADRTAAKAARRKLPPVAVLGLNRRTQDGLDGHHRAASPAGQRDGWWPVRGHFRLQAFGPGRTQRRLVYIAPTTKGNLNGPLIGRPQVHRTG